MSASGVGGLVLSNVANACFETIGYRWALRVLGFFQFVFLGIAAITCYRLNPAPKNVPLIDFKDFKNKNFCILVAIHFIGNFAFYVRLLKKYFVIPVEFTQSLGPIGLCSIVCQILGLEFLGLRQFECHYGKFQSLKC